MQQNNKDLIKHNCEILVNEKLKQYETIRKDFGKFFNRDLL